MRALVIERPGSMEVKDVPDPRPAFGEVLVEVRVCGLCGTDVHIADGEFSPTPYPIIPGHEFSGTVVDVASAPGSPLSVGDRVAVDPSLFCGSCNACRSGRGNLCAKWGAIGDTVDGAFAELVAVPAANAYRLPDHVGLRAGALVEPLSCALHGIRRLGAVLGEDVLIVGAGTMGLLLSQLIRRAGAGRLVVVDKVAARRQAALDVGASDVAGSLAELDDAKFAAVVDVTGSISAIEEGFIAVQRGGRLLIFGVAPADARAQLSPFRIYNDEITIVGSMAVLHSFRGALELIASGAVNTDVLLTHALSLDRFPEALSMVRRGEGLKVHVLPSDRREGIPAETTARTSIP